MNAYPIQVTLIDSSISREMRPSWASSSPISPTAPRSRLNICDVSWVRLDPAAEAGVSG